MIDIKDEQYGTVAHEYPYYSKYMFPLVMKNPDFCRELINRLFPNHKVKELIVTDEKV